MDSRLYDYWVSDPASGFRVLGFMVKGLGHSCAIVPDFPRCKVLRSTENIHRTKQGCTTCETAKQNSKALSVLLVKLWGLGLTWTPKACRIMAFRAVIMGIGLLFYILLGCRA